jgi:hypothetical protein
MKFAGVQNNKALLLAHTIRITHLLLRHGNSSYHFDLRFRQPVVCHCSTRSVLQKLRPSTCSSSCSPLSMTPILRWYSLRTALRSSTGCANARAPAQAHFFVAPRLLIVLHLCSSLGRSVHAWACHLLGYMTVSSAWCRLLHNFLAVNIVLTHVRSIAPHARAIRVLLSPATTSYKTSSPVGAARPDFSMYVPSTR